MIYIGTQQERWQLVVDKEKQRLKRCGKVVVHASREPDCDSSCCIKEYESYCEKFNLQIDSHVESRWYEDFDNIGDKQEAHFILVSVELNELVIALKTFEFSTNENHRENRRTLKRLIGRLVIENMKHTIELNGNKKVSYSSYMGSDADSGDDYAECRGMASEYGLAPHLHVEIIDYENFKHSINEHEFCFDLHFIVISNELHQLIESNRNLEIEELTKVVTANNKIRKYNDDCWEDFCQTNGLGDIKSGHGDGIVYFLLFPFSNLLKIGFTTNLEKRLSSYRTHCAENFRVIKTIPGTKSKEKFIHKDLKDYRRKREFFRWNETVQSLIQNYD